MIAPEMISLPIWGGKKGGKKQVSRKAEKKKKRKSHAKR